MPKRQMLVNYVPGEECRIAITEDGRLEEFYQERASNESHVGNIYKGKVCNVEPSIQAAFIEFGLERNGFLHISDLHPKYFPGDAKEETETVGLKTPRRDRPPIQRCLRRGQEILVQVLKEGIGTKGPTLTSYLSIPGRYLVMMPHMERLGVSRKIEDDEARRVSRDILHDLKPPEGFGFIIRTAGIGRTKTDLKRDLAYLQRLWKNIDRRMKEVRIGELFAESDLVIRTIRDIYSSDIDRIIVDDETAGRRAQDFLAISNPRSGSNVMVYRDKIPIFHRYDVESQIETINAKVVPLESGGSLVIESTEALVAIDVNSGKSRESRDAEMTAYKTNLEATDEICRQLRLRDLGGVVVNDLIDMRNLTHRREIEQRFRENLKRDRARTRTLPISQFGILEMTRQRMRPSLKKSIFTDCPSCAGAGLVKSPESVVLDVMRRLALAMHRQEVARIELTVSPDVAFHLLNRKRTQLVDIELTHGKPVTVRVNGAGGIDFVSLAAFDLRGGTVEAEVTQDLGEPKLEAIEGLSGLEEDLFEEDAAEEEVGEAGEPGEEIRATLETPGTTSTEEEDREDSAAVMDSAVERAESAIDEAEGEQGEHAAMKAQAGAVGHREGQAQQGAETGQTGEGGRRRRRRRRRGRHRGGKSGAQPGGAIAGEAQGGDTGAGNGGNSANEHFDVETRDSESESDEAPAPPLAGETENVHEGATPTDSQDANATAEGQAAPTGKRRRRRRGGRGRRGRGKGGNNTGNGSGPAAPPGLPGSPGPGGGGAVDHGTPPAPRVDEPRASRGYHNPRAEGNKPELPPG